MESLKLACLHLGLGTAYYLGGSGCRVKICPKGLSASLRKNSCLGDPKTKRQKLSKKLITWTILIYFQENRLPRKKI